MKVKDFKDLIKQNEGKLKVHSSAKDETSMYHLKDNNTWEDNTLSDNEGYQVCNPEQLLKSKSFNSKDEVFSIIDNIGLPIPRHQKDGKDITEMIDIKRLKPSDKVCVDIVLIITKIPTWEEYLEFNKITYNHHLELDNDDAELDNEQLSYFMNEFGYDYNTFMAYAYDEIR